MESRIARLLPLAERVPSLEDRILFLEENNKALEKEVRAQNIRVAAADGILSGVRFERDEAQQQVELMNSDFAQLQAENEKLLRQTKDEVTQHEQTRKVGKTAVLHYK